MPRQTLNPHEQLIMQIMGSSIEQLEQIIRIAKATLAQKKPRVRKPKQVETKAS